MPVSKGKNCVADEMHQWKHTGLHSGRGKGGTEGKLVPYPEGQKQAVAIALNVCGQGKGKKGKGKTSDHAEALQALGFSEEAALLVASFAEGFNAPLGLAVASGMVQTAGFIESEEAAKITAQNSYEGDVDHTPGKQKPQKDRVAKQDDQGSIATFPTVPHSEGPMVAANKGKCPTGTRSVGGGFCKNPKAGNRQYFEIEKGKSCPPGSRGAGKGRCRVDFAEPVANATNPAAPAATDKPKALDCPPKKSEAEKQAEKAERGTQDTTTPDPQQPKEPPQPKEPKTAKELAEAEERKREREACKKSRGN